LIIFASDNGSSEPIEAKNFITTGVKAEDQQAFVNKFNDSIPNIGNANSLVNYGAWGVAHSVSPLSYFKASQGEGGIRDPLIMKLPGAPVSTSSSNNNNNQTPQTNILRTFVHVTDMTPTILDFAGVQQAGTTYNGMQVHPIMGKSIKPLSKTRFKLRQVRKRCWSSNTIRKC
jgi:arylsulfatase